MDPKVLIITSCSKQKLSVPAKAIKLYKGQFFKNVVKFAESNNFDTWIISAKYGLIPPNKIIKPYNQKIHSKEDIDKLKDKVHDTFTTLLNRYDIIIFLMGKKYLMVFDDFLGNSKIKVAIDNRGSGGFLQLISNMLKLNSNQVMQLLIANKTKNPYFSINDVLSLKGYQSVLFKL